MNNGEVSAGTTSKEGQ